jgi:hypothetical protein
MSSRRSRQKVWDKKAEEQQRKAQLTQQIAVYQHLSGLEVEIHSSERKWTRMNDAAALIQRSFQDFLAKRRTELVRAN